MKIAVVRDIDSFSALKAEWNALLAKSSNNTLFLRWEWIFYHYKHMCKDEQLFILLLRSDKGELDGIAPFILREERIVTKKIFLEIIGQRYSYYVGIIANGGNRDNVYEAIFGYLLENQSKWDAMDFVHLSDDEALKSHIRKHARKHGYCCRETIKDPCKVLSLAGDFQEYMSSLDPHFAKRLKYYLRSINRDYDVKLFLPRDERSLKVFWDTFLALHEERVRHKGLGSVLSNRDFREFYYAVAQAAYKEKNLSLIGLTLDGEMVAVLFGIVWNGTFYFLNIGYREYSKYSIGLVLPLLCIERSIESGLEYFDLLGGGGDYKGKLGGVDRGGLRIQVMKRITLVESMVKDMLRRTLRKVRRWIFKQPLVGGMQGSRL